MCFNEKVCSSAFSDRYGCVVRVLRLWMVGLCTLCRLWRIFEQQQRLLAGERFLIQQRLLACIWWLCHDGTQRTQRHGRLGRLGRLWRLGKQLIQWLGRRLVAGKRLVFVQRLLAHEQFLKRLALRDTDHIRVIATRSET